MENTGEMAGALMHMRKNGSFKPILFGFVIGICLLVVGGMALSDKKVDSARGGEEDSVAVSYETYKRYKEETEREVEALCLGITGVKSAHAVAFFDGVGGSIYAQNSQSGNTERVEYVIIGSGSSSHALYLGESLPSLSGIGVVCDTGNSQALRNEITALLGATYGLSLTRVYVTEGK